MSELIWMEKDGQRIQVHLTVVEAHKKLGWMEAQLPELKNQKKPTVEADMVEPKTTTGKKAAVESKE